MHACILYRVMTRQKLEESITKCSELLKRYAQLVTTCVILCMSSAPYIVHSCQKLLKH